MERGRVIAGLIAMAMVLLLFPATSAAQEKMVMVGIVKSLEGRRVMEVENEKDKSLVSFRIGRRTVYNPKRYPVPGERVQVEYLPHRGSLVAYTVMILGERGPKESTK